MGDMTHTDLSSAQRRPRRSGAIVRAKPLHESAVERLRDMIIEGRLAVGGRLHEANLAAILCVSRTPIREAIKLLATEGLVDLLPGRGARVSGFSIEHVRELFEAIAGIERNASELAAERMSEREFEKLKRIHDRMAAHHAAGERQPYFKLNQEIPSRYRRRGEERHPSGDPLVADHPRPARALRGALVAWAMDGGDGGARAPDGGARRPKRRACGRDHAPARSRHVDLDRRRLAVGPSPAGLIRPRMTRAGQSSTSPPFGESV